MVLPRPTALRNFAPSRLVRATPKTSYRRSWQRFASSSSPAGGHGHGEPTSDLPWLIGAIAVTVPSCWYLWPESSQGHAHHPPISGIDTSEDADSEQQAANGGVSAETSSDEETEEPQQAPSDEGEEAAKDANETNEQEGGDKKADEGEEAAKDANETNKQAGGDKKEGEDSAGKSGNDGPPQSGVQPNPEEGEKLTKRNTDGKNQPEDKGDVEGVQFKGKTNMGDSDNKMPDERKIESDSKGGLKKRIDSGYGKNLGEGDEKREDGSETAATSKPPQKPSEGGQGDISGKQFGLSNTPTRYSKDIANDPNKSKKGEGTPETAKSMGTVEVGRPTAEQGNADRANKKDS